MAEMNREGIMLIEEMKNLFPEIVLLLDVGRFSQKESVGDIEIVLDHAKEHEDQVRGPQATLTNAVLEADASDAVNGRAVHPEGRKGERLTTLLVRETGRNRDLAVSGAVIEDTTTGTRRRVPIDEFQLTSQNTGNLFVNPGNYSLLQHAQDTWGGFLNLEYYERMNANGYKPTVRSLFRHLVNSAEFGVAKDMPRFHQASLSASTTDSSSTLGASTKLEAAKSSLDSRPTAEVFHSSELKRKLGLDDSFSSLEKSAFVGFVSLGMAFSLLRSRRNFMASQGAAAANQLPSASLVRLVKSPQSFLSTFKRLL